MHPKYDDDGHQESIAVMLCLFLFPSFFTLNDLPHVDFEDNMMLSTLVKFETPLNAGRSAAAPWPRRSCEAPQSSLLRLHDYDVVSVYGH